MADEKNIQDIAAWKKKVVSESDRIDAAIREMPREVVFALAKDPEVGQRISEAINRAMRPAAATPQPAAQRAPVIETPAGEAGAGPQAEKPHTEREALAASLKARKEREEREEKDEIEKKLSVLAQIARMDVGQKAKLARNGDKEARSILIKEGNKLIALAVLANPKITSQEIEMVAASRNVSEDVLREIAGNKDWTKGYAVMLNLANNPKTPIGVTLTYLPRLLTRDLRSLAKSKGVPEVIRLSARKMAQKRAV